MYVVWLVWSAKSIDGRNLKFLINLFQKLKVLVGSACKFLKFLHLFFPVFLRCVDPLYALLFSFKLAQIKKIVFTCIYNYIFLQCCWDREIHCHASKSFIRSSSVCCFCSSSGNVQALSINLWNDPCCWVAPFPFSFPASLAILILLFS